MRTQTRVEDPHFNVSSPLAEIKTWFSCELHYLHSRATTRYDFGLFVCPHHTNLWMKAAAVFVMNCGQHTSCALSSWVGCTLHNYEWPLIAVFTFMSCFMPCKVTRKYNSEVDSMSIWINMTAVRLLNVLDLDVVTRPSGSIRDVATRLCFVRSNNTVSTSGVELKIERMHDDDVKAHQFHDSSNPTDDRPTDCCVFSECVSVCLAGSGIHGSRTHWEACTCLE